MPARVGPRRRQAGILRNDRFITAPVLAQQFRLRLRRPTDRWSYHRPRPARFRGLRPPRQIYWHFRDCRRSGQCALCWGRAMSATDLRRMATALGGEITGGQILCPGPGHSHRDRSLSVRLGRLLINRPRPILSNDVRFTPVSDRLADMLPSPKGANSRHASISSRGHLGTN
jgi:hypothetical protein